MFAGSLDGGNKLSYGVPTYQVPSYQIPSVPVCQPELPSSCPTESGTQESVAGIDFSQSRLQTPGARGEAYTRDAQPQAECEKPVVTTQPNRAPMLLSMEDVNPVGFLLGGSRPDATDGLNGIHTPFSEWNRFR